MASLGPNFLIYGMGMKMKTPLQGCKKELGGTLVTSFVQVLHVANWQMHMQYELLRGVGEGTMDV